MDSGEANQKPGRFQTDYFSSGFVSVPVDDVFLPRRIFLPGFEQDGAYYCFHSRDPYHAGRVLYKDVTPEYAHV